MRIHKCHSVRDCDVLDSMWMRKRARGGSDNNFCHVDGFRNGGAYLQDSHRSLKNSSKVAVLNQLISGSAAIRYFDT